MICPKNAKSGACFASPGGCANITALLYMQAEGTILAQSNDEAYETARYMLMTFADIVQRIDPIHVYQVRPVTLWQAAAVGVSAREILGFLREYAAHPIPYPLQQLIVNEVGKWGRLRLQKGAKDRIVLRGDPKILKAVYTEPNIQAWVLRAEEEGIVFHIRHRAELKRALTKIGYPVLDLAGYRAAPSIAFDLDRKTVLRDYQETAIERFMGHAQDQSGVIVLPCGAGKTVVGLGILARLQLHALVLTPSESSAEQWLREAINRTTLTKDDVSLYNPGKPLTPVTITTYQRVTSKTKSGERKHLKALTDYPWGIVIYDEVHMLPAPLFRLAADLQAARRLGLSATLIREDGAEGDVFSLIGAKCYEIPWKVLERQGYLARIQCFEVHVPLSPDERQEYERAGPREQHRLAAQSVNKFAVVKALLDKHKRDSVLIIGHYLNSLHEYASTLKCPLITGQTPQHEREFWLAKFRNGGIRCIVLSRIANMAIDLPCASIAIQVSGLFASRQEEAQRLGRLLRPETSEGVFYSLVSERTVEERMAKHRQLYLVEQGYAYEVVAAGDILEQERMNGCEAVGMPEYR